eukprot:COSAG01_NODE_7971_length_2969_cov_7.580139_1_plen_156_part_00
MSVRQQRCVTCTARNCPRPALFLTRYQLGCPRTVTGPRSNVDSTSACTTSGPTNLPTLHWVIPIDTRKWKHRTVLCGVETRPWRGDYQVRESMVGSLRTHWNGGGRCAVFVPGNSKPDKSRRIVRCKKVTSTRAGSRNLHDRRSQHDTEATTTLT